MKKSKDLGTYVPAFLFVVALCFVCVCVWFINWQPAFPNGVAQQSVAKANIGQAFGVLSACFSALAFGAALYTIHLQQKQLELQRQELEKSQDQLRRTTEAQERSVDALQKQAELLATSARLRGLAALMETDLKMKELRLTEAATYGVGRGQVHDLSSVIELHNELADEMNRLSERNARPPEPEKEK